MHTWRLRETAGSIIDSRSAVFLWVSCDVTHGQTHSETDSPTHTHTSYIAGETVAALIDGLRTDYGFTKFNVYNTSYNLIAHNG